MTFINKKKNLKSVRRRPYTEKFSMQKFAGSPALFYKTTFASLF